METKKRIPVYGKYADEIFEAYDEVFVLGDVHNNDKVLLAFLKRHNLITNADVITSLDEVSGFSKNILLVFLGDVIGKLPYSEKIVTYSPVLTVMNFIIKHRQHCLLVIGNHEVSFLMNEKEVDGVSNLDLTLSCLTDIKVRPILEPSIKTRFYKSLEKTKLIDKKNFESLTEKFEEKLKEKDKSDLTTRLIVIMFILQYSEFLLYLRRLKMYFVHAGFDFNRPIDNQLLSKTCNIRAFGNYKKKLLKKNPWYKHPNIECCDTTFVFGHESELCQGQGGVYTPFIYRDTKKRNDFVCIDTECYVSDTISYVYINPKVNPYSKTKQNLYVIKDQLPATDCHEYMISIFTDLHQ